MLELIRLAIELIHLILFLIEKIKHKKNNNRCPEQVTVIIFFLK